MFQMSDKLFCRENGPKKDRKAVTRVLGKIHTGSPFMGAAMFCVM